MMNYFFYVVTIRPDTWEQGTRERDFLECVKNTHSQIALRSIWATILRIIRGGGAL